MFPAVRLGEASLVTEGLLFGFGFGFGPSLENTGGGGKSYIDVSKVLSLLSKTVESGILLSFNLLPTNTSLQSRRKLLVQKLGIESITVALVR